MQKVNRKAAQRRAALCARDPRRQAGRSPFVDARQFDAAVDEGRRTRWSRRAGLQLPIVLVAAADEDAIWSRASAISSASPIVAPSELEVAAVVWARSLLVSESALELVEGRAS